MAGIFIRLLQFGLLLMLLACPVMAQEMAQQVPDGQSSNPANGANAFGQREADRPVLHNRSWRYLLRLGDVLQLSFPLTPDFNQIVTVQPASTRTPHLNLQWLRSASEKKAVLR